MKKKISKKKSNTDYNWVIKITVAAFTISLVFSFISEKILPNANLIMGIILVLVFIIIGVIFDMIGVAVTASDEKQFHSMSSRKVKGAKTAVLLKKNAEKMSSFCNDVIGDICGIISGSAGVVIASKLASILNVNTFLVSLIVTALIAAATIGGKALGKGVAISKSNDILFMFSKVIAFFKKEK